MGFSFRLERFCCCCNLRTGTLVIGTVGWVFTVMQLVYLVGPALDTNNNDDLSSHDRHLHAFERHGVFTEIGYGVVTLIVCVLLVVGVYRRDNRFMLPWLVLKCFELIILVLIIGIYFVIACAVDDDDMKDSGLLFLIPALLTVATAITWYCWLCVYSHYRLTGEGVSQDGMPPVYYTPTTAPPPAYCEAEKSKFGLA